MLLALVAGLGLPALALWATWGLAFVIVAAALGIAIVAVAWIRSRGARQRSRERQAARHRDASAAPPSEPARERR